MELIYRMDARDFILIQLILDYMNCDFESDCSMNYNSIISDDEKEYSWILEKAADDVNDGSYMPSSDATYRTINTGSYMRADFSGAEEGALAVLKSRAIDETDSIKCINFQYYIHGNKNPGSLKVTVNMGVSGSEGFEVPDDKFEDKWHMYKVSIAHNVRYLEFEAVKGIGEGTIAIDDINFTTCNGLDGLDELEYCTFEDLEQCGIDDFSDGWRKGIAKDLPQYIKFDADLTSDGYVYYITPAMIPDQNEALVRFEVKTNKTAFQFSYIFTGESAAKFFTEINDQRKYIDVQIADAWIVSECISVPNEYDGDIIIGLESEDIGVSFLAIDNVRLLHTENCEESSLTCNFALEKECNFKSDKSSWTFSDKFVATRSGVLHAPIVVSENGTQHCFAFIYKLVAVDSIDTPPNLYLYKDTVELWKSQGHVGLPTKTSGQVTVDGGVLRLQFASKGSGLFEIYETKLTSGGCVNIADCSEFLCSDKCLPNDRKCDRTVDCVSGEDENEDSCGFKFDVDFSEVTTLSSTGFETPLTSNNAWKLLSNSTIVVDEFEISISEQILVTYFTKVNPKPSILESFEYHLDEESCIQINYLSDAAFGKVELNYQADNDEKHTETVFQIEPSTSTRHISVPVQSGNVRVLLSVYMLKLHPIYSGHIQSSAVFAIKQIIMHAGKSCQELFVDCPDDIPNMCSDKRSCYTDEKKCDLMPSCYDNSDEVDNCGYGIVCDFEHKNLCGYTNNTVARTYWDDRDVIEMKQSLWERTASMTITRPPTDHTYQVSGKGHFMTSKNHEGLLDEIRYVDVETMTSPFQTFIEDGCVTFWYYLNSTSHQPKSTSAQIFVYLQYKDTTEKQLLWFDHINRPFPTWSQGGISVEGNRSARLIVTAKTSIPYDAYTGVVSFDDVEFISGDCLIPKLDCDEDMFKCYEDKVCIPRSMVCDGGPDCLDASDELHCDRPDGAVQLVGGDGTYGKLAYFYNGVWRPVCYPTTDYEQSLFKLHTAHYVCKQLHFRGNSDAFSYRLWEQHSPTQIQLSCEEDGSCSARATVNECNMYAYIRCSDDVCFSGERLCPGTRAKCVPESFFCDGQQDCPENMDEKQCLCFEGEDKCLHIPDECKDRQCETCEDRESFECQDHQCIPLNNRCDGVKQCYDGTDEYRCVQIDKDFKVTVFLNSTLNRETVCGEDVDLGDAESFCRLAGQGYVSEISISTNQIEKGVTAKGFSEKLYVLTIYYFEIYIYVLLLCHELLEIF
ncbi:uncharacterized protein LOC132755874 [Ruditapes philippinarum]|uniref:uncharacterized protein LOC132755874 n=1 Tax=Ruditapes philippinarum TaxID=129788 RepID=UPI00295AA5F1|nr:uncharacterized protein LOC132755874 [Ruditapes philippinarum]